MRIALCNEVLGEMPFSRQCDFVARLGYDGLEVAPYTLADDPLSITPAAVREFRKRAEDAGTAVTGLHWLLLKPKGLSITSADAEVRAKTVEVIRFLVTLCAELGGRYLVHGSPAQRRTGRDADAAQRATECWVAAGEAARAVGVIYCVEPLATPEADFVNTVQEAAAIVEAIGNPHLRTMLDCCSAARMEPEPIAAVLDRWLPTGLIGHVQVNDRNRQGPGQGSDAFAPVFDALLRNDWQGDVAVEPFDYEPDGPACAARAIGYIRGMLEALEMR
jgi:D-psicose/D-tagatose/L-ribulose 3-epimerase